MLPLQGQWPLERGGKHFQGTAPCGHSPHQVGTCFWGVTALSSSWASQWFGLTAWEPQVRQEVPGLFYEPLGKSQCMHE